MKPPKTLMGIRLRREREERGLSRPELARLILAALPEDDRQRPSIRDMAQYIGRWERGRVRGVSNRYQRAYAAALNMDRRELFNLPRTTSNVALYERPPGLWTGPSEALNPRSGGTDAVARVQNDGTIGDDMSRRALLRLLTAVSTGTSVPIEDLKTVLSGIESAIADRFDIEDREHTITEYAHAKMVGPGSLIEELSRDMIAIGRLLKRRHAPLVQADLLRAAAGLSGQLATEFTDIGDERAARLARQSARYAADASMDWPSLTSHRRAGRRSGRVL